MTEDLLYYVPDPAPKPDASEDLVPRRRRLEALELEGPAAEAFEEFWKTYPRRESKKGARVRFAQAVADGADPAAIVAAAQAFREYCVDTDRERRFIRHAERWLSEKPWEVGQSFVNRPRRVKANPDPTPEDPLLAVPDDAVPQPAKPKRAAARSTPPGWTSVVVPTAVYRLLGKGGVLLYVGVSSNVKERIKAHEREKPWWNLVEQVDVRTKSAYGDFFVDEYEACLNEFPVFNVDLVPWRCWRPSTGNKAFDRIRDRADIAGAVARLDDAGVRGRLDALRSAFRGTYTAAVEAVGPSAALGDPEAWRRLVLIAAEERFLKLDRKPPRERGLKLKPAATFRAKDRIA